MLRALRIEYLDAIYQWPTVCNRPKTKVNRTTNMNSALCKYSGLTPLRFCLASLLMLALAAHTTALGADALSTKMSSNFKINFKATTDPKAKRDLVIKAIDDGVIKRGLSLKEAKDLFGDDFQSLGRDAATSWSNAVVFFEPAKPAPKPMMSALQQGWYLDLSFTADGRLEHYSLSNLHK